MNPVGERELNLRGFKIPVIENLGVTQDLYELIDLSDNALENVSNFPLLKRLRTIMASNNRISQVARGLGQLLPGLENLILANNRLARLEDLAPLGDIPTLERVSLQGNPVSKHRNYRLYLIALLPKLRVLDYNKVKAQEREKAVRMFGVKDGKMAGKGATAAASAMDAEETKTFVPGQIQRREMTAEERKRIALAIESATSVEEIAKLEAQLVAGKLPST